MNKKIILLISLMFCIVSGAQENSLVTLTPEENRIYQDLVFKYKNNKLTMADDNRINRDILAKQHTVLSRGYHSGYDYWGMSKTPEGLGFFTVTTLLGSVLLGYVGDKIADWLQYFTNKDALSKGIRKVTFIGSSVGSSIALFPWQMMIGNIILAEGYNLFYHRSNSQIINEKKLIHGIVKSLSSFDSNQ
jgi:uncharacterized membrane protein YeaQ/YmgE (transglycosylase-associated protein family)